MMSRKKVTQREGRDGAEQNLSKLLVLVVLVGWNPVFGDSIGKWARHQLDQ